MCRTFDELKIEIGQGANLRCYENSLVRIGLSEVGCYYELINCQMPDFGARIGNLYEAKFINQEEAEIFWQVAKGMLRKAQYFRVLTFLAVYDDWKFYGYLWSPEEIIEIGTFQDSFPRFFKISATSDSPLIILWPASKGNVIFVRDLSDRHFLLRMPKTDEIIDLVEIDHQPIQ